ncbi:hypothetical protein LEP1GSC058_2167 [Leptospira fainei serovar Hurstbridge str. BUT 6]|uniref:Uncharacterized protein n=1 Tax=Leptospira fainei serovar Hurstbridge str. BUT 6 TaxID=1193011 RepID=S3W5W0_9LEPT|nr:hypothetical protein LEP1GSC058_2167 [Leptospira fainei serovar Hurstbridge str. BUT 6]
MGFSEPKLVIARDNQSNSSGENGLSGGPTGSIPEHRTDHCPTEDREIFRQSLQGV